MKQIRLFVDAHVFDSEFQGSRTYIREIYRNMAGLPGVTLIMAARDVNNLRQYFPKETTIEFIQFESKSSTRRLLFEIPRLIRKHRADYAHFQYVVPPVKACRYIVTIHDLIFNDFPGEFSFAYRIIKNLLFGASALRSDIITTVSEYSKRSITKYLFTNSKEIHVTVNGVSDKFLHSYKKELSATYISKKYNINNFLLYVSRFEPRKNHFGLLRAFIDLKLHEQGYQLVLLGHRSIKVPAFDDLLESLTPEIRSQILIFSDVNDDDLLHFYKAAHVFVYPSKAEGFGIPPLEAAALKVPVLCSNSSAMGDFTFFGRFHFNPEDYEMFKARLSEIITAPPGSHELEQIANTVANKYSWRNSSKKLYEAIILDNSLTE